jgi:hypothetical protein
MLSECDFVWQKQHRPTPGKFAFVGRRMARRKAPAHLAEAVLTFTDQL